MCIRDSPNSVSRHSSVWPRVQLGRARAKRRSFLNAVFVRGRPRITERQKDARKAIRCGDRERSFARCHNRFDRGDMYSDSSIRLRLFRIEFLNVVVRLRRLNSHSFVPVSYTHLPPLPEYDLPPRPAHSPAVPSPQTPAGPPPHRRQSDWLPGLKERGCGP